MQAPNAIRSPNWPPLWADLVNAYDGPQGLADAIGYHYQSLWRWGTQARPVPTRAVKLIRAAAAAKGVKSPV